MFFLFVLTFLVFFLAYRQLKKKHPDNPKEARSRASGMALFFLAINALAYFFVTQENTLYSFDSGHYWAGCVFLLDLFQERPDMFFLDFLEKWKNSSASPLPYYPLMAAMTGFGNDRAGFILSVTSLYAFPAVLLLARFTKLFWKDQKQGPFHGREWIAFGVVLLFPHFWAIIWRGYPDVGGLIFVFWVLILFFDRPPLGWSMGRLILIGFLLAVMIVIRRWYAYWVVSFLLAAFADALYQARNLRPINAQWFWHIAKPVSVPGAMAGLGLGLMAPGFLQAALSYDISQVYSAYRRYEDIPWWQEVLQWYGLSIWALFFVFLAAAWLRPDNRRVLVFLMLQLGLSAGMTQWGMIDHHGINYLFQIPMLSVMILGIHEILNRLVSPGKKVSFLGGIMTVLLINFACVFCPKFKPLHDFLGILAPGKPLYPQVRNDIPEFKKMVEFLDSMAHPNDAFYILASSEIFNDTLILNFNHFFGTRFRVPYQLLPTIHWDYASDYKTLLAFLSRATFILVADPIQYHLRPSDQRSVGIPAKSFIHGKDIAVAFDQLPQVFELDQGVKVYVYVRMRDINQEDWDSLKEKLEKSTCEP